MHKFFRGAPPVNMEDTKKKFHNQWGGAFIHSPEHEAIGERLYECQAHYCAYCDVKINDITAGHIEHLERRRGACQRTFDWNNMFFSCNNDDSCGNFKDDNKRQLKFNSADIVDPSLEDPADFFVYDDLGNILPRDAAHRQRAEETIRVFNLNNARLMGIRSGIARSVTFFLQCNPSHEQMELFLQDMVARDCPSVCLSLLRMNRT